MAEAGWMESQFSSVHEFEFQDNHFQVHNDIPRSAGFRNTNFYSIFKTGRYVVVNPQKLDAFFNQWGELPENRGDYPLKSNQFSRVEFIKKLRDVEKWHLA